MLVNRSYPIENAIKVSRVFSEESLGKTLIRCFTVNRCLVTECDSTIRSIVRPTMLCSIAARCSSGRDRCDESRTGPADTYGLSW
jgi:hypothetical protein